MKYDFDKIIDRRGTDCVKYDKLNDFFGTDQLIPLWVADMDFEVCPAISQALQQRMAHTVYGYGAPSEGFWQSIIQWQARRNDFHFTTSEVIYVPGIVRGIAFAVNYFTAPGDKIVIQEPVYHPFKIIANGNNRTTIVNHLIEHDGSYSMDFADLERLFRDEHPKMMVLCNPHNPIGIAWKQADLAHVAQLAKKYGVIVISDEIHGDLALYGNRHCVFANSCPEAADVAITFGAPSKTFNIAGIVSSWCVIKNPELRKGFFDWMECNEFCAPTFMACVATEAAYNHGEEWLTQAKQYIEQNIDFVADYCKAHTPGIVAIKPEASFLVWLDCRALGLSQDALVDLFVRKAHLGLNRGDTFGESGNGFMRFNVGAPRQVLAQALDQLASALRNI